MKKRVIVMIVSFLLLPSISFARDSAASCSNWRSGESCAVTTTRSHRVWKMADDELAQRCVKQCMISECPPSYPEECTNKCKKKCNVQ